MQQFIINVALSNLAIYTHTTLAGRDDILCQLASGLLDFYSHAPRGARLLQADIERQAREISTHTPLAGRD